jgi:crossover junction endodeoxyribonuclease RuvC
VGLINIAGIDPSLTSTGISTSAGTEVIKTTLRGASRLSAVSRGVIELCENLNIDLVIIESYSFASRNSQAHSIGELGGCIRMLLWESNIPFIDIPPTSRAKFATGKGNAGKSEVISAISSKTGILFSGGSADDECDAWVLREMGIVKIGESQYSWTKEQLSSLEKIDWSPLDTLLGEK